jgi:hypothetical protein
MRSYKFFLPLELDSKLQNIPCDIAKQSAWKKYSNSATETFLSCRNTACSLEGCQDDVRIANHHNLVCGHGGDDGAGFGGVCHVRSRLWQDSHSELNQNIQILQLECSDTPLEI